MYIKEILQYLLWPALITVSWLITWYVLKYFEKAEGESTGTRE